MPDPAESSGEALWFRNRKLSSAPGRAKKLVRIAADDLLRRAIACRAILRLRSTRHITPGILQIQVAAAIRMAFGHFAIELPMLAWKLRTITIAITTGGRMLAVL